MKTTIELPDDLLRDVKVLAAREGRTMKELLAEMIRAFMKSKAPGKRTHRLTYDEMPLLKGKRKARAGKEITPERVYEVLYGGEE
jgi:predicted transcriptional regulator